MHKFSFPFSGDVAATSPRLTRLLGPYSGESARGFSNSRQPRLISLGSRELVSAGEIGALDSLSCAIHFIDYNFS